MKSTYPKDNKNDVPADFNLLSYGKRNMVELNIGVQGPDDGAGKGHDLESKGLVRKWLVRFICKSEYQLQKRRLI